jgi:putative RNA 2'-phosphotransferase
MKHNRLSKTISHALRHEPWLYELELDDEGWTPIEELLSALRVLNKEWTHLSSEDLKEVVEVCQKKRFELKAEKIRALYGHSTPCRLKKQRGEPPELLYHGTSAKLKEIISQEGLKPMGRHHVHLSTTTQMATEVGRRKSSIPIIFAIKAKKAHQDSIIFYEGNECVWLADFIPPEYIELLTS